MRRRSAFIPAVLLAGITATCGLTACGGNTDTSAIQHETSVNLEHLQSLPSNIAHGDPINYGLTGGAPGEYMRIACPDGTTPMQRSDWDGMQVDVTDEGIYIDFTKQLPAAFVINADDHGQAIYLVEAHSSFIPNESLTNLVTPPSDFADHIVRYCAAQ